MVRTLRLFGAKVISVGVGIIQFFRFLWAVGFLLFTAVLVIDLFRIPVSVNSSHKYAFEQRLWAKMSPEEEQKLLELQKHCHHVYRHHGYFTYYCPICRKKLIEGSVPLTQL